MAKTETKRALVVGLGLTGYSCVRHLAALGYATTVVDTRREPPKLEALKREFPQVAVYTGEFPPALFDDPGMLVVSPGMSVRHPEIARAVDNGVPVVGDIELFARQVTAPVIAITGSNGKSTVTALTGEMCRLAGLKTAVGGNIGVPALSLLEQPVPDVYVIELSSFQLELTASLNARAATVLNITPDHLDRYRDIEEYAAAKARIFRGNGTLVLNADDPWVMRMCLSGRRMVSFNLGQPLAAQDYGLTERNGETWLARGLQLLMPTRDVPLAGRHNLANVLAAMALAEAAGITPEATCVAVRGFKGLKHRTELVAEHLGVRWYDDSKGTNVGATVAALNGMTAPVILIAGGDGKGQDFNELKIACRQHARAVVLIGRDAPQIEATLGGVMAVRRAKDMHDAVRIAHELAQTGDVVLLSPACASFDMFRNYEHRAEVFREAVREVVA
ncbi:MAG: UDP-N-acetylmuramoyl-L-alanine--D-glutamate ligase [Sulfuricaulis sp.]|uniref:UDP-N-acetylmuramoyl-L-alanine--D-glutamate ligase n=1 Tax=Sulfuricaulis sp. TaxID=2003553 RepID=UPI0034A15F0C